MGVADEALRVCWVSQHFWGETRLLQLDLSYTTHTGDGDLITPDSAAAWAECF